jgi:hypothetical protein
MSDAIRYVVGTVMVGVFFWVVFVMLVVWASLVRALEWLADSHTENLARLAIRAGSLANAAWSRSHLGEMLSAFKASTPHRKHPGWTPPPLSVIHAARGLLAERRFFRD